ncbi:hypothetical protein MWH25_01495 [Natroniella acetigena]|uniref:hypothetical protein n=1 Tax=Natroniella acetigena TaxID=52004 RepID=UPI00200A77B7|nr:hypothetical protein [Natroniella acetigena]MCK8826422.1 hypothetical protein [Natroniella acetigena]
MLKKILTFITGSLSAVAYILSRKSRPDKKEKVNQVERKVNQAQSDYKEVKSETEDVRTETDQQLQEKEEEHEEIDTDSSSVNDIFSDITSRGSGDRD